MLCEIQELVTYTDEHPTPDAPGVLATARAFVRFSNGDEVNFDGLGVRAEDGTGRLD